MDITDILASVTRAHVVANGGLDDGSRQHQDLQLLTRAWISERVSPELLPYPSELMDRIMTNLRTQIETIEDRTASMDAGTSFTLVVLQTELERFKFHIRSFLRTRIAKIDAHPLHILGLHDRRNGTTASLYPLLSPSESQYAQTHCALLERHYAASFLSAFPPKLRQLDDRAGAGGVGMVEGPDLEKAVIVRCLGSRKPSSVPIQNDAYGGAGDTDTSDTSFAPVEIVCGFTEQPPQRAIDEDIRTDGGGRGHPEERTVRMNRGDVWIVRWSSVRDAVLSGECELL